MVESFGGEMQCVAFRLKIGCLWEHLTSTTFSANTEMILLIFIDLEIANFEIIFVCPPL